MTETRTFGQPIRDEVQVSGVTTKPEKTKLPTVYDTMRSALSKPAVVDPTKNIKVGPTRPGFSLKISTDLPLEKLDRWRIAARKTKGKEALDMRRYNSMVIGSQTVCLVYEGEDFLDDEGNPQNFMSAAVHEMLGAFEYEGAIKNFFERDADIIKMGSEILEACGYLDNDDEDEEDPLDSEAV
jgi:hypothetical protein